MLILQLFHVVGVQIQMRLGVGRHCYANLIIIDRSIESVYVVCFLCTFKVRVSMFPLRKSLGYS